MFSNSLGVLSATLQLEAVIMSNIKKKKKKLVSMKPLISVGPLETRPIVLKLSTSVWGCCGKQYALFLEFYLFKESDTLLSLISLRWYKKRLTTCIVDLFFTQEMLCNQHNLRENTFPKTTNSAVTDRVIILWIVSAKAACAFHWCAQDGKPRLHST